MKRVLPRKVSTSMHDGESRVHNVLAILESQRVVTLVGAGGIGKSRLQQAVVEELLQRAHAPKLVELCVEDLRQVEEFRGHVLDAVNAADRAVDDDAAFVRALDGVELLVIDGAEGLRDAIGPTLAQCLQQHPALKILVTSRTPLGISAETLFDVEPLALEGAARALFLERARARDMQFVDEEGAALHRVLIATSGLPLAVELAAAQMRSTTCSELAARLVGNEHRLVGGMRDAPGRHHSLAATIASSVDALSPRVKDLFIQSGAFAGAFDREGITALLAAAPPLQEADLGADVVGSFIQELLDASLVRTHRSPTKMRFAMLASVHAFAQEALAQHPRADAIRQAHAIFFGDERSREPIVDDEDLADFHLARAYAQVRRQASRDRPQAHREWGDREMRCALAEVRAALFHGIAPKARRVLATLDVDDLSPALEVEVRLARVRVALVYSHKGAPTELERAKTAWNEIPDDDEARAPLEIDLAEAVALTARVDGDEDVQSRYAKALRLAEDCGDSRRTRRIRSDFAAAQFERRNFAHARELFVDVLEDTRAAGDRAAEGVALTNLALVEQEAGDFARAKERLHLALEIHREIGNARFAAITLGDSAGLSTERGALLVADQAYSAATEALHEVGDARQEAIARAAHAFVLAFLAQTDDAGAQSRRAERLLRVFQWSGFHCVVDVYNAGIALVALARECILAGPRLDREDYARRRDAVLARIKAAVDDPQAQKIDEMRLARRLIGAAERASDVETLSLGVTLDGARFVLDGNAVENHDKKAQHAIFAALVDNRLRESRGLDREALIDAGWPGEKMSEASARNRLHVTLAGLRKGGLQDCVSHDGGRYRLQANAPLVVIR